MELSLSGRNPAGVLERILSVETSAGRPPRPWQRRSGGEGRRSELGALLGRVARGDQDAFEQVYQHVAGPVYGLVLRVVRDPAQAEEVAQEVLVDVWRTVEARLEREQVRRCLGTLTELQRESVTLAYYSGYTYREVAELLHVPLGTVKTRMRDGLIRMRDCLGVGEQ
jgi:RNA polymerase sigma-70 factor (ECF subfamily)